MEKTNYSKLVRDELPEGLPAYMATVIPGDEFWISEGETEVKYAKELESYEQCVAIEQSLLQKGFTVGSSFHTTITYVREFPAGKVIVWRELKGERPRFSVTIFRTVT